VARGAVSTAAPPRLVAGLELLLPFGAAVVAALTVVSPVLGLGAAGGLVLVVVAAHDLCLALALWIPTLFLEALPVFNLAGKAGGLVILGAWVLHTAHSPDGPRAVLHRHRATLALLLLLLAWLTLTVLWAPDWLLAAKEMVRWYAVAALFAVVATSVRDLRTLRWMAGSFSVGGVLSVLVSLQGAGSSPDPGRIEGAAGDPNFLGAWLLAAGLLTLGLLAQTRRRLLRVGLFATLALLAAGTALTLSRGAFVAAFGTTLVAVLVLRGRRLPVVLGAALATAAAAVWLRSSPTALDRLASNGGGSGRQELWTVAWRMARDHPLRGVGIDNYVVVARSSMREVGPLTSPYLMTRPDPDEVHNVYLQLLAEGGPLAVVLLLAFTALCVRSALQAARRLDLAGQRAAASLAYAVLLAQCSLLCAAVFLSSADDKRLWLVLALGPAVSSLGRDRPLRESGP